MIDFNILWLCSKGLKQIGQEEMQMHSSSKEMLRKNSNAESVTSNRKKSVSLQELNLQQNGISFSKLSGPPLTIHF
jgi:hypothetical protein